MGGGPYSSTPLVSCFDGILSDQRLAISHLIGSGKGSVLLRRKSGGLEALGVGKSYGRSYSRGSVFLASNPGPDGKKDEKRPKRD
jgi:hypothetical protein